MQAVARLVTHVDVDVADARRLSVSARHEAVLDDGRRVLLLDDRGWTSSASGASQIEVTGGPALTSVEDIEDTARLVVGPDEPLDERPPQDPEDGHWATLADVLRQQGVPVQARDLSELPHDVVLSERLRAHLG